MTRRDGKNAVVAVDFVARTRIDNPLRERAEVVNFHEEFAPTIAASGQGGVTMGSHDVTVVPSGSDPLVGAVLEPHKYEIVRLVGQGGFGAVYEARKQPLGRRVAIKRLTIEGDNPDVLERFEREARILARLEHPSIVSVIEFFKNSSGYFIVLEFVEGKPLSDRIATDRLGYEFVLRVFRKVFSAVAEGHKHGIIHRDIKAENVVVHERDDGELVVKVLDYGIARVTSEKGLPGVGAAYTQYGPNGFLAGTPYYMAPELASGKKASEQTDVYALGVLMYYAVTNSLPYTVEVGDDVDTGGGLLAILAKQMSPEPIEDIRVRARNIGRDVPDKLADAVMKALAKDPAERWRSVVEFRDAVEDAAIDLIGRASTFYSMRPSRSSAAMPTPVLWSKNSQTFAAESGPASVAKLPAPPATPFERASTMTSDHPAGYKMARSEAQPRPKRGFLTGIVVIGVVAAIAIAGLLVGMRFRMASSAEAVTGSVALAPATKSEPAPALAALPASAKVIASAPAESVRAPAPPKATASAPPGAEGLVDRCLASIRHEPGASCKPLCEACERGLKHSFCESACRLAAQGR